MSKMSLNQAMSIAIASGEAWNIAEFDTVETSSVEFSVNFYKKRDAIIRKYSGRGSLNVIKRMLIIAATVVITVF